MRRETKTITRNTLILTSVDIREAILEYVGQEVPDNAYLNWSFTRDKHPIVSIKWEETE